MFNFDRRSLIILLIAMFALNLLTGTLSIESIIFALPGVIVAMTFHEFAHALVATKLGDDTPRLQGRLNLNPLSHIDPAGLVCLILLGFGWGKPVEINSRNFNGKYSLSKAEAMVAAAGPIMNFILAFVFILIAVILNNTIQFATKGTYILMTIVSSIASINLGLGIFNLIPVYPLDGSKILNNFLPFRAREWMMNNQFLLTILLLIFVFGTNVISYATVWTLIGMEKLATLIVGIFL